MTIAYKVLGQGIYSANTAGDLYTVPNSSQAVISTITVCNQAATDATFRIAVRPAGATLNSLHYINYDTKVPANDTVTVTIGITLAGTDVITVRASTSTVSFGVFGSEIS